MLPDPCASSSASGSCFVPAVMPSATTAESSDSMAPSMAMAKAAGSSARSSSKESASGAPLGPGSAPGQRRQRRQLRDAGVAHAGQLVAEAAADRGHVEARAPGAEPASGEQRADGQRDERRRHLARPRGQRSRSASVKAPTRRSAGARVAARAPAPRRAPGKCSGSAADVEAEEVLELQRGDDDRDAGGEAGRHRVGHELDQPAEARRAPIASRSTPGHQRRQQQPAEAEARRDRRQDDDEGGGRAGDLHARAAAGAR